MNDPQLAEIAKLLFSPVTLVAYTAAMIAYLYSMSSTVGRAEDGDATAAVRPKGLRIATGLGLLAIVAHGAHLLTWSFAAGRYPLGNMFEFSNVAAFVAAIAAITVVQWRLQRPDVVGFVFLGVLLTLGLAVLVYTEPGPLMPILDSWWRAIHVSTIVFAFGVFTVGAVFTALYLLRETAERRVAEARAGNMSGSTVGAAFDTTTRDADEDELLEVVPGREEPDASNIDEDAAAYGIALRRALARPVSVAGRTVHVPVSLLIWTVVASVPFALVFQRASAMVGIPVVALAAVLIAWWFVPSLPAATTLDSLAYRTNAFGFPLWTFGVIAGAIWAEQSWGRFWGWDPKETSAFLTWVAYAGYLHARATRGVKGRGAAWIGLGSYGVLLFTYYVVNLLVTGLHSYAGL
ncbi:MAG: cytochrome c biogenesis protein CcsA [Nitriliruptorales bacterium]|nr:cytochrome c biogenesis protein CcsA [Nitriliruptorales bacterium]